MTLVRSAGSFPAEPTAFSGEISRTALFACAGVLAALNAQASQIIDTLKYSSALAGLGGLAGISAIIWITMFVTLRIGFDRRGGRTSGRDLAVAGLVVLLSLLPISIAAKGGLLLSGAYLFSTSEADSDDRKVALLLLALTSPLVWGRLLLNLFAAPILSLDAHFVGALVGSQVDGNTIRSANGVGRVVVETPCSSVHNMSLAVLLWITTAVLFNVRLDRRYVAVGAAMIALMFTLNIGRIAAIALFPSHYETLHVGIGAGLFGWAGLIGAVLIAGFGVAHAVARQR